MSERDRELSRVDASEVDMCDQLRKVLTASNEPLIPGEEDMIQLGHAGFMLFAPNGTYLCSVWKMPAMGTLKIFREGEL